MNGTAAAEGEGEFFALTKALGEFKAGPLSGNPSDRALARAVGISPTTVSLWLRGERFPQKVDQVLAIVHAVATAAKSRSLTGQAGDLLDAQRWRHAHRSEVQRRAGAVSAAVQRSQAARMLAGSAAGWPPDEAADLVALEVQRGRPPVGVALSGLPRKTATFTGRDNELRQVLDLLDPARDGSVLVQISAVSGLGGIGKTELILQAAHAARERGWFPGGVLFVNLFGYDPARRVAPGRALDGWLRALGVPKENIPHGIQDKCRLYASILEAHAIAGRAILVVIDNAWSAEQAEPLLPPVGAGRAVITSRHVLAGLDARLIELKPLNTKDAVALLDKKLRLANGPGDTRVQDTAAARDLAALCGGLPLAVQITGANLAADRSKTLRQMASDLQQREDRLDEMQYGDQAVRSSFELSYQALPTSEQRLFRLLTVNAGPGVSVATAAAIAGQDQRPTRRQLDALGRAHLIEGGTGDRWHMHDLVRLYAEDLGLSNSTADSRAAAEERLLHHYMIHTTAAIDLLWGKPDPETDSPFPSSSEAVSWLKAEHANLTAAVVNSGSNHPAIALKIAIPLGVFLGKWTYADEYVIVTQAAVQMARTLRSAHDEAPALANLGLALQAVGRAAESLKATTESVALYRKLASEDPGRYEPRLGRVLANLGGSADASVEDRLAAAREAVKIGRRWAKDQDIANPDVELAGALHNLGNRLSDLGRHSAAVRALQEAVDIRRIQATRSQARFEIFLGEILTAFAGVLSRAGRLQEALTAAQEGVAIFRRLAAEDPDLRGPDLIQALNRLAKLFAAIGQESDAQATGAEAEKIRLLITTHDTEQ
jgi:tetratricopeptide (TPR) repeat protein/transcriptional regulator with XRE-family HTH domain